MEFSIESFTDANILSEFTCGLQPMDDFIHQELQSYLNNGNLAYCVRNLDNNEIIAFFVIALDTEIIIDDDFQDDLKTIYDINANQEKYQSLEIEYLAVLNKYQKQGLGRACLDFICENYSMFFPNKSIDLITVSAYKSAQYSTTMFYYKCDFSQLEDFNPNSDTLRMYKPIKP